MKKIIPFIVAQITMLLALSSCNGCSGNGSPADSLNIITLDSLPRIVELEGIIGDGTSMNELEIISANGDTTIVSVPNEMVKGDVKAGDLVNVIYFVNHDENLASTAINITAICHLWTTTKNGTKQSIELDGKGVAISYNTAIEYDHWQLKDGFLVLQASKPLGSEKPQQADTFEIMSLTSTQLVLMKNHVETVFELEN